jgi:hypothetical protein
MKKVKKIKRVCETCGAEFEVLPCRVKERKGRFCSRSCAMIGQNNPNWIGGKVKQICQVCGNEFEVLACRVKEGRGKYCSQKCLGMANGIYLQERIKGDKNPNWKGGVETQHHADYTSKEYAEWRKSIFERDNYTCQICQNSKSRLNAHHIFPYSEHPDIKYFLHNGITLCVACHIIVHKILRLKRVAERKSL